MSFLAPFQSDQQPDAETQNQKLSLRESRGFSRGEGPPRP
jgi:hypothetical protein